MDEATITESNSFSGHAPACIQNNTINTEQNNLKCALTTVDNNEPPDRQNNSLSNKSRDQNIELHNERDVLKVNKDVEDSACKNPDSSAQEHITDCPVSSHQTSDIPVAHQASFRDTKSSHDIGSSPNNLKSLDNDNTERKMNRSYDVEHEYDVTSDIGDECSESEENSNENQPFISNIYVCPSCGWAPEMEKCPIQRSVQAGYTNGMYQFQGIMPSQIHGFSNYNYGSYAAGQRPGYPCGMQVVPASMDMRFNPATNQVIATSASRQNQNVEDYTRTIQSLRRKTFCLSIFVIFLVFAVITLAILIS